MINSVVIWNREKVRYTLKVKRHENMKFCVSTRVRGIFFTILSSDYIVSNVGNEKDGRSGRRYVICTSSILCKYLAK